MGSSLLNALIGEYRVVESLGAGGMGEVYKAVHTHLGRVIAIKVLSPDLTDGPALARFYGEANIQARLKHPGVAEYLGFYEYQGRPCILMEYVDGESLARTIRRRGGLPVPEAVRIVREIAGVAAHFHAEGLVHRDLKANNVKIDSSGRVRILDFGIARYQSSNRMTRIGAVIGTPEALAPEQVRGAPVTEATDVWQLGVLFYELLTGRSAFLSDNTQEMYARILSAEFPSLTQWRPEVPAELEAIVARCLQKNPARRYPSAAELHAALCDWETKAASPPVLPEARRKAVLVLEKIRDTVTSRMAVFTPSQIVNTFLFGLIVVALAIGIATMIPHGPRIAPAPQSDTQTAAPRPALAPDLKTVTVDTADGTAQVFMAGKLAGSTPFRIQARTGEKVELILRRSGYKDLPVQFDITERHDYTYTLQPSKED